MYLLLYTIISIISFVILGAISVSDNNENLLRGINKYKGPLTTAIMLITLGCTKLSFMDRNSVSINAILAMFVGYLAFNTYTDKKETNLYCLPMYIFLAIGCLTMFYCYEGKTSQIMTYFIIYILIQKIVLQCFYASGDAHMFLVCASFLTVSYHPAYDFYEPMMNYMTHMTISLLFFLFCNLAKRNVNAKLSLKKAMPFAPAISLAAIILM